MKWIFLTLLFVNLGYFAWHVSRPLQPAPAPQAHVSAGQQLQLLSEQRGASVRDIEVQHVLNNPLSSEDDPAEQGICQRLGPFDDVLTAQDVAERFNTVGFRVELRAVDVPTGEFDYRIVMPPLPSLQEAFRKLRELKSRNIDSYVITQGPTAQGISLGVFSTAVGADQHQDWLRSEGYEANIKTIPRVTRAYWIYRDSLDPFPAPQLTTAQADFSAIQVVKSGCLN